MNDFKPDGIFSERLAPDTLLLDCNLSDKNHQPSDVTEIFDPPGSGKVFLEKKERILNIAQYCAHFNIVAIVHG